jgi:AraC family transcriptional activator FtrA
MRGAVVVSQDLARLGSNCAYLVESMAAFLGVSRRQLHRDFKEGIGLSPKDWLQQQRVHTAIQMIENGKKLEDVSRLLGFSSYDKFYREVRKYLDCSPAKFKEQKIRLIPELW